jgi:hypothetical protein
MNALGFSTGAIALGDFRRAIHKLRAHNVSAIELSALRLSELAPLIEAIPTLDLNRYSYVSFHAPTRFSATEEQTVVTMLHTVKDLGWPIVVHPDSIIDRKKWRPLGSALCFENMDKRKPIGRTAEELHRFLESFEESYVCFDIGHASQIDRTMSEALLIVQDFGKRIRQVHMSEVNTKSEHCQLSESSRLAYNKVVGLLDHDPPVIIESVLTEGEIDDELAIVSEMFAHRHQIALANW